MRIGVVGAGWSGLAAATFLQERGHDVELFEATQDVGGRIQTRREEGYLIEAGPHAVIPAHEATRRLLDLADEPLVQAPPRAPRYVLHKGRPRALPGTPPAILTTPLLSPLAKLRLLREPFQKPGPPGETVAAFARRRLGRGSVPLVDAFVTGVYAGDPERLVLAHAFPELHHMDRHGGLLRGLGQKRAPRPALTAPLNGMASIVHALARRLRVRTRTPVERVRSTAEHAEIIAGGASNAYDHVVVATDPHCATQILRVPATPPPVAPVHVVAFGVREDQLAARGYGILAPDHERAFILGALFESSLFPGRAPPEHALLRCLVGGRRHPERASLDPVQLAQLAWRDLAAWDIVRGEPARTVHLPTPGIPQPEADHDAWLRVLRHDRVHVLGIGNQAVGLDKLAAEAERLAAVIA